jgi:hypothetical protein
MRGGTATLLAAFALSLLSVAGMFHRIVKLACKRTARISLLSVLGFNGDRMIFAPLWLLRVQERIADRRECSGDR